MNTEVFAVIEHHHLAAALVVNVGAFHQACHHGVADVVGPETVAVVAQVETLDLLGFGACREHRVFQDLVAVVVVVHLDRDTLLGLVAAIVADNRDACVDFPGLFGGGASVFEEFHVHGELVFAPEVGRLAGFGAFGVVVVGDVRVSAEIPVASAVGKRSCGVQAVGGVEHVVVIYGQCYDRHRDVFADKVCLRGGVGRLSVHEFGAADHRILGNLFGLRNLFGTLGGERTVKGAADFATFLRGGRFNRQVRIETCLREERRLGFVVVFVFLESA